MGHPQELKSKSTPTLRDCGEGWGTRKFRIKFVLVPGFGGGLVDVYVAVLA
jgi:hypothetical protein